VIINEFKKIQIRYYIFQILNDERAFYNKEQGDADYGANRLLNIRLKPVKSNPNCSSDQWISHCISSNEF
jgi:hypothetical protein